MKCIESQLAFNEMHVRNIVSKKDDGVEVMVISTKCLRDLKDFIFRKDPVVMKSVKAIKHQHNFLVLYF